MPARKAKMTVQNAVRAFLEKHPERGFTIREIADELQSNFFSVGDAVNILVVRDERFVLTRGEGTVRADGLKVYFYPIPDTAHILNEAIKPGTSYQRLRAKRLQKRIQTALIEFAHGFESGHVSWSTKGRQIVVVWRSLKKDAERKEPEKVAE
jgi:hypothetical protein